MVPGCSRAALADKTLCDDGHVLSLSVEHGSQGRGSLLPFSKRDIHLVQFRSVLGWSSTLSSFARQALLWSRSSIGGPGSKAQTLQMVPGSQVTMDREPCLCVTWADCEMQVCGACLTPRQPQPLTLPVTLFCASLWSWQFCDMLTEDLLTFP